MPALPANESPPLSVVFAARHDSQTLREALVRHHAQAAATGAELLIADGSEFGLPDDIPVAFRAPGTDVFELRALAIKAARGATIAITEDHCVPAEDWYESMLRAHAEHPEAPAVSGAVLNGSKEKRVDWANFLFTFGPFVPPLGDIRPLRVPPPFNLSYKRDALADLIVEAGDLELRLAPRLYQEGATVLDERIVVTHVQSHSLCSTTKAHFSNGRATVGIAFEGLPLRPRIERSGICMLMPYRWVREVFHHVRRAPEARRAARRAAPVLLIFACAHAFGELVGVWLGAGNAADHLD